MSLQSPHICDHAGLACDTTDIAKRWLVTEIHYGGHHFRFRYMAAIMIFGTRPTSNNVDSVITHIRVGHGRKCGDRRWNSGAFALFKSYFHFRFQLGSRSTSEMSGNVDSIHVGPGRKCGSCSWHRVVISSCSKAIGASVFFTAAKMVVSGRRRLETSDFLVIAPLKTRIRKWGVWG